jgi:hypothetical protein
MAFTITKEWQWSIERAIHFLEQSKSMLNEREKLFLVSVRERGANRLTMKQLALIQRLREKNWKRVRKIRESQRKAPDPKKEAVTD